MLKNFYFFTSNSGYKIGTLYGFNLLVKTENSLKEGFFMKQNRFFIEGEGNIKYSHNNGHIANDPKLAVRYFLNALEKIPSLIEKYEKENEKISKDLPVLQEVVHSTWRKENELKDLKTELAILDRKMMLSHKHRKDCSRQKRQWERGLLPADIIMKTNQKGLSYDLRRFKTATKLDAGTENRPCCQCRFFFHGQGKRQSICFC
jgi:hypothetical protein